MSQFNQEIGKECTPREEGNDIRLAEHKTERSEEERSVHGVTEETVRPGGDECLIRPHIRNDIEAESHSENSPHTKRTARYQEYIREPCPPDPAIPREKNNECKLDDDERIGAEHTKGLPPRGAKTFFDVENAPAFSPQSKTDNESGEGESPCESAMENRPVPPEKALAIPLHIPCEESEYRDFNGSMHKLDQEETKNHEGDDVENTFHECDVFRGGITVNVTVTRSPARIPSRDRTSALSGRR
jgi:hypothetical protein